MAVLAELRLMGSKLLVLATSAAQEPKLETFSGSYGLQHSKRLQITGHC